MADEVAHHLEPLQRALVAVGTSELTRCSRRLHAQRRVEQVREAPVVVGARAAVKVHEHSSLCEHTQCESRDEDADAVAQLAARLHHQITPSMLPSEDGCVEVDVPPKTLKSSTPPFSRNNCRLLRASQCLSG